MCTMSHNLESPDFWGFFFFFKFTFALQWGEKYFVSVC